MDPEILAAIEEQLGELQNHLGAELDEETVSMLLQRVGENAEQTGEIDLLSAHNELLLESWGDDVDEDALVFEEPSYEEAAGDGYEDWVEGQTQMLERRAG
jgi:hypothetical protein